MVQKQLRQRITRKLSVFLPAYASKADQQYSRTRISYHGLNEMLFHIGDDPLERRDLMAEEPEAAEEFRTLAGAFSDPERMSRGILAEPSKKVSLPKIPRWPA